MSWTPITGKADYTNGLSVTPDPGVSGGTPMKDPWLNTSGNQDYSTYETGHSDLTIVPDPGNSGLSAPLAGGPYPYHE